jgi:molybdopterin-guanine dinucleotide biosynthesis protein A
MESVTGIILAGGKSRRMGMEKGLVEFNGKALIDQAITVLKDLCSEILISSNSSCYDHLGYKVVPDLVNDSGPMGGIYSCLRESKNRVNLVLSCDLPFVTVDIFNHLARQAGSAWISVPWYENDHYEPLCGIYLKDCLPDMQVFMEAKNHKLPELFVKTSFIPLKISDIYPSLSGHYFMNINSPEDLESAAKFLEEHPIFHLPNWLIVYGTNRNAGKTTLITRIISHFHSKIPVCAVKISPHFHEIDEEDVIIAKSDDFIIVKEVKSSTGKDSSRMLDAGAGVVLYVQVWDNNLGRVLPLIIKNLPSDSAVICESGWARNLVEPGLFLILNRKGEMEIKENVSKPKLLADRWIEFDGRDFDFNPDEISFQEGAWGLRS